MKEVVAIKSENGSYFYIGKGRNRYYLKNRYTEIPNEFGMYDLGKVKEIFNELCERIPESVPAVSSLGHPNSFMRVVYSDRTEEIFTQGEAGRNLCAYTSNAANYSEFFTGRIFGGKSEYVTLDHLRWVCSEKEENMDVFIKALKDFEEDDYLYLEEKKLEDGTISIDKHCYGNVSKGFVSILPDGRIGNDGGFKFVKLMKAKDVRIKRYPEHVWRDPMAKWYWENVVQTELDF